MHIDHFLTRDTILDGETFKYKIKITSRMPPAATKKTGEVQKSHHSEQIFKSK